MTSSATTPGSSTSPPQRSLSGAVVDLESASRRGFDRLRSSRDVTTTLRRGRHRAGRVCVVHARPNDDGVARLTVLASRKVGTAVRRNRAKRLLREAARLQTWLPGQDVVLVARPATAGAGLAEVIAEVASISEALGVVVTDRIDA